MAIGMAEVWPNSNATYETYINPNAKCPVCHADVYFYQSPYGGRVFFDELGPPWPKHPCTDLFVPRSVRVTQKATNIQPWAIAGWIPVNFSQENYKLKGDWEIISLKRLDTGKKIYRAVPRHHATMLEKVPALMQNLDNRGVGKLSLCPIFGDEKDIWLNYRGYALTSIRTFERAILDDVGSMGEIGLNISLDWFGSRSFIPNVVPPKWAKMAYGRRWLMQAAKRGSAKAANSLGDPRLVRPKI